MAFEGFLGDARARPTGLQVLGYAVSVALHGPPITAFTVAWLTTALVVGSGELEQPDPGAQVVYYQVPVALMDAFPGVGRSAGQGGGVATAGGDGVARRGAAGPAKRRTRRPLMFLRGQQRVKTVALSQAAVGPDDVLDEDWAGLGGGGTAGSGDGPGAGAGQSGPGGQGEGPGGTGFAKASEPNPAPTRAKAAPGVERNEETGDVFDSDDETVVGAPLPGRPVRISMDHAAYLRTYETFPSPLPESCWPPGRTSNAMLVEVCVTERGEVNEVVVRQSAGKDADLFLSNAIRSWRYRPRIVQGSPLPFCHPIRIVYKRELRFDRRF